MPTRTLNYRGRLRLLVLYALSKGYTHGYSIMKYLENLIGYSPGAGSIYPSLRYLKSHGFVEITSNFRNGRAVKEYRLTSKGVRHLKGKENELCETLTMVKGFRILLDLGWNDVVQSVRGLIISLPSMKEDQKRELEELIKAFSSRIKDLLSSEVE